MTKLNLLQSPVLKTWTNLSKALVTITVILFANSTNALSGPAPKVTVSIAPIHSIAAFIMDGVAKPELLLPASASPHDFALKPSQADLLSTSELVIWVGPQLEVFLEKPLSTIVADSKLMTLVDLPKITLLEPRDDEAFVEGKDHDHYHDHKHGHDDHGSIDPHIWLSLANSKVIAQSIAEQLSLMDPQNSELYRKNLNLFLAKTEQTSVKIKDKLSPLSNSAFLVYHDAYHYFEDEYGLNAAGAFSLNPEIRPGARKLKDLAEKLVTQNIRCIFSEPQFDTKPIDLLMAENSDLKINTAVLDPLGSAIEAGPNHYFTTIETMGDAFAGCLSDTN